MTTFTVSELGRVSAANYFRRGLVRRRKNVASVGSGWTEGEELRSPPPSFPKRRGPTTGRLATGQSQLGRLTINRAAVFSSTSESWADSQITNTIHPVPPPPLCPFRPLSEDVHETAVKQKANDNPLHLSQITSPIAALLL